MTEQQAIDHLANAIYAKAQAENQYPDFAQVYAEVAWKEMKAIARQWPADVRPMLLGPWQP